MKIAFVTRELPISPRCGGIGHYVWDMANKLTTLGNKVIIIAASDSGEEKIYYENGIKIILLSNVDYFVSNNKIKSYFFTQIYKYLNYKKYRENISKCLDALIINNEIDIVEFPEYGNEAMIWARKGKRNIPMVIRLHGPSILNRKTQKPLNPFFNPIRFIFAKKELETLKYADAISAASLEMLNFFKKYFNIYVKNEIVIYNSIDFNEWYLPIKMDTKAKNEINVFSAGSVTEGKGYKELFEACKILNNEGYKVNLTIAGKLGKLGLKLKKMSKKYKWLTILGQVSRKSLKNYYNEADITCFPSWWEPFGLVCIEAMAAGGLVIGSSSGGMKEIIEDNKDGFLVQPKDVKLLKNKIKEIINLDENIKKQIRKNAQNKIKNKFHSDIMIKKQIDFYTSLIEKFKNNN